MSAPDRAYAKLMTLAGLALTIGASFTAAADSAAPPVGIPLWLVLSADACLLAAGVLGLTLGLLDLRKAANADRQAAEKERIRLTIEADVAAYRQFASEQRDNEWAAPPNAMFTHEQIAALRAARERPE